MDHRPPPTGGPPAFPGGRASLDPTTRGPAAARVVRCPFRTARYAGRDMTLCPGFDAELRWVGLFQSRDRAMVCSHLVGGPNPARHSRVAACTHPEAVWVVHSVRRILDDGSAGATAPTRRVMRSGTRDRFAVNEPG